MNVLNLSTGLGPILLICHYCGRTVATGRTEWTQMSAYQKTWFIVVSCIYAAFAYFNGGLSLRSGIELLKTGSFPLDWGFTEPIFWLGGILALLFVIAIQIFRVLSSCHRTNQAELVLGRSLLNFDIYGQVKVLIAISFFEWAAWAITRFPPYQQPQTSDLLIILAVFAWTSYVIHLAVRQTDEPIDEAAAAERRNSVKLFEALTSDLDPTKPLRWVYCLKANSLFGSAEVMRDELRSMGFIVELERRGPHATQPVEFQISEVRMHYPETFALRLEEVDSFAKFHQLEVSDCVASNV